MAVFRVYKTAGYTVMSNYHLRDKNISLKAKGLLTQMLSLPEDWDYTREGLAAINKEGESAIHSALVELEEAGYVRRSKVRDENGRITDVAYDIFEQPENTSKAKHRCWVFQQRENALTVNMTDDRQPVENTGLSDSGHQKPGEKTPLLENPLLENRPQLNTKEINKELIKNGGCLRTHTCARETDDDDDRTGFTVDPEEARRLTADQSEVIDAAERAGFPANEATRYRLDELTIAHGKGAMLEAIAACVENSVPKLNYLAKVLTNRGRDRPKPGDDWAQAMALLERGG